LWILIVFLVQAQLAWGLWLLRSMDEWRYPEFLLLLSGPLVLYTAAAILFPASASGRDLVAHLMQHRRAFFSLMLAHVGFTALFEIFLLGNGFELVPTAFRLVAASLLVALAISERRGLHWALAVLASQLQISRARATATALPVASSARLTRSASPIRPRLDRKGAVA
jgi:hypothetical protein